MPAMESLPTHVVPHVYHRCLFFVKVFHLSQLPSTQQCEHHPKVPIHCTALFVWCWRCHQTASLPQLHHMFSKMLDDAIVPSEHGRCGLCPFVGIVCILTRWHAHSFNMWLLFDDDWVSELSHSPRLGTLHRYQTRQDTGNDNIVVAYQRK